MCVGYFITWLKLNWEVAISVLHSPKAVISFWYQHCILALKSPDTKIMNGLLFAVCSTLSSKFLNEILKAINSLQRISGVFWFRVENGYSLE